MKETNGNGLDGILSQAIEAMKEEQGEDFSLEKINLAELSRRTGITRARLRRWKRNGFRDLPDKRTGRKRAGTVLDGYTGVLDGFLRAGIRNSVTCLRRLRELGYKGGQTVVRDYLREHKDLMPAPRRSVEPQGGRTVRYTSGPGECYQMDWGFVDVDERDTGEVFRVACFAMICHHCGRRYIEFFPNAKQESLFAGMLHAFSRLGVPQRVLTDNMKSVVTGRDATGRPLWNLEYSSFMDAVGFTTRLCKPRHPYTKGKVERLVRHVKENFLAGRRFWNLSDLNEAALAWCDEQDAEYRRTAGGSPLFVHDHECLPAMKQLSGGPEVERYLYPLRKVTYDGFVSFEGRRFGVPWRFQYPEVRVGRNGGDLVIFSADLSEVLAVHKVTWSRLDSFCPDQFGEPAQPEEEPTQKVATRIERVGEPGAELPFDRFDFSVREDGNDQ